MIAKVSFAGSPLSTTVTLNVHVPPQVPENVAVVPVTVRFVTAVLMIVLPAAESV